MYQRTNLLNGASHRQLNPSTRRRIDDPDDDDLLTALREEEFDALYQDFTGCGGLKRRIDLDFLIATDRKRWRLGMYDWMREREIDRHPRVRHSEGQDTCTFHHNSCLKKCQIQSGSKGVCQWSDLCEALQTTKRTNLADKSQHVAK